MQSCLASSSNSPVRVRQSDLNGRKREASTHDECLSAICRSRTPWVTGRGSGSGSPWVPPRPSSTSSASASSPMSCGICGNLTPCALRPAPLTGDAHGGKPWPGACGTGFAAHLSASGYRSGSVARRTHLRWLRDEQPIDRAKHDVASTRQSDESQRSRASVTEAATAPDPRPATH
jgi:hypothetical protein